MVDKKQIFVMQAEGILARRFFHDWNQYKIQFTVIQLFIKNV